MCCKKPGQFVTIQATDIEETPLVIGNILVRIGTPACHGAEYQDLCDAAEESWDFDETKFNDDRNDMTCYPTTTTTTTSLSTTPSTASISTIVVGNTAATTSSDTVSTTTTPASIATTTTNSQPTDMGQFAGL